MDKLPELLGRPYCLEDEDADPAAAHADAAGAAAAEEDMDIDGPPGAAGAGPGSRRPEGCYTLEELLQRVQVCWVLCTEDI